MKEKPDRTETYTGRKEDPGRPDGGRLPEDLRALSHRIRRSEKAYERMSGKRHD